MAAVLLVRLADETAFFLPAAALESFRTDLGLTYAQAGAVLALIAPGALVGTVFAVAADRGSRRAIASGGAFAFAAGMAAFASGASFPVLSAAAFAMGVASTAMVDAAEVALVDLAADHLRPALARANLLATVGDVLGPALVAAVALLGLSWRATFWAGAAALALYGLMLAAAELPRPAPQAPEEAGSQSSLRVLVSVARDGRVWLVGLMSLLMGPFDEALLGFTIALLERERGASAGVATLVALVGVSGGLVTFTVLARRLEGVAEARLLVVSGLTMTLGAVMIAFLRAPVAVTGGAFVTSIGLNLGWLALQHRTLTLRPGEVGSTKAVVSAIEFAGAAIPIGIGAVADGTDLVTAVALYALLGLVFTALAAAGLRDRPSPSPPGALETDEARPYAAGGVSSRPTSAPAPTPLAPGGKGGPEPSAGRLDRRSPRASVRERGSRAGARGGTTMTEHKSFKRKVRARMAKTGERYGAARRVLLRQGSGSEPEVPAPAAEAAPWVAQPELSDEAIRQATGRDWSQWCAELDAWGATGRSHTEIARHVNETYEVPGWWAQSVAVGYERIRGLRARYQRRDGTFVASASKTFDVPVEELWEAVSEETRRAAWLPDAEMRLRTATPPKVIRYDWVADGSRIALHLTPKGETRSHLAVEHQKLADAESVAATKALWKERLGALAALLER